MIFEAYRSNLKTLYLMLESMTSRWDVLNSEVLSYRLLLTELYERPRNIDQMLWETLDNCRLEQERLTRLIPRIWTKIPWRLRRINEDYQAWLREAEDLIEFVTQAKKGATFYSRMQKAKAVKKQHKGPEPEGGVDEVRQSVHALIRVVHFLFVGGQAGESIVDGSGILRLEDAIGMWKKGVQDLTEMLADPITPTRRIVGRIDQLRNRILESMDQAQAVLLVEKRMREVFESLQLYRKTERRPVPADDVESLIKIIEDEVPSAWANGRWDDLQRSLITAKGLIVSIEVSLRTRSSSGPMGTAGLRIRGGKQEAATGRLATGTGSDQSSQLVLDDQYVDDRLEEILARYRMEGKGS